jgi:hypothetical protein
MFSYAFTAWHSAKKWVGYSRNLRTSATTSWPWYVIAAPGPQAPLQVTVSRSATFQCIDMIWQ